MADKTPKYITKAYFDTAIRKLLSRLGGVKVAAGATSRGASGGAAGESGAYEPALGNPTADGDILASTTAGVRSWLTKETFEDKGKVTASGTELSVGGVVDGTIIKRSGNSLIGVALVAAAGEIKVYSVAAATARNSNAAQKSTTEATATKLKETKLNEPMKGIRISFLLTTSSAGHAAYAQIYRNGSAIGTLRSTTNTLGETFTQDFDTLWATDDLIQIYAYSAGGTAYVEAVDFCYDRAIAAFGAWDIVTYLPTVQQTAYSVTNQDP